MKKWLVSFLIIAMIISCAALGESSSNWQIAPVITQAYELSSGELYLEWEGAAPVYQVYMDGECIESTIVNNAILPVKNGTHSITVYPISEAKSADTKIELGLTAKVIGASVGLDLAALGLDPKNLTAGTPSSPLNIDYTSSPIFSASPEELQAVTDPQNRVHLSFTDRYYADEYIVSIKINKDVNYVKFTKGNEESDALIEQTDSLTTLTLDPAFLKNQECMIPQLDNKYSFTVQLRKYAENMLDGEKIPAVIHLSKESSSFNYTPTAAWKTAPVISYASQTADGQITLQWEHEDYGLGCKYSVVKINKSLGIKTSEEILGETAESQFVINDLSNDTYSFSVVPAFEDEQGFASEDINVEIQNNWVIAPILACEACGNNSVHLSWPTAEGIESYHITVYCGNSDSLLRFVNLDYSEYDAFDLPVTGNEMEYTFIYEDSIDPEIGMKLKFEIFGIRHTENGEEQKTASTAKSITIGLTKDSAK